MKIKLLYIILFVLVLAVELQAKGRRKHFKNKESNKNKNKKVIPIVLPSSGKHSSLKSENFTLRNKSESNALNTSEKSKTTEKIFGYNSIPTTLKEHVTETPTISANCKNSSSERYLIIDAALREVLI